MDPVLSKTIVDVAFYVCLAVMFIAAVWGDRR